MAYTKRTWTSREVITTAKIQNIEDGIAAIDAGLRTAIYECIGNIVPSTGTEFEVTAGTGLTMNIAAGTAYVNGYRIYRGTNTTGVAVAGNSTLYIYLYADGSATGAIENRTSTINDPARLLLATVVTGASSVTTVTDKRVRGVYAVYA